MTKLEQKLIELDYKLRGMMFKLYEVTYYENVIEKDNFNHIIDNYIHIQDFILQTNKPFEEWKKTFNQMQGDIKELENE